MRYLLNPIFLGKTLKSYFFDTDRIWKINSDELNNFQEKKIQKIVNYAYNNIPFYKNKFNKVNIRPNDIQTLEDFKKIPITTKKELLQAPSNDLRPLKNKKVFTKTTTSGTKGEPLSIYITMFDIVQGLIGYLRTFKEHGINWREDNIALIVDLRSESAERKYLNEGIFPSFKPFMSFDNIRVFNFKKRADKMINDLNKFQPDFIGGYVGKLAHLALLKGEGLGDNICPKVIGSSGDALAKYTRKLVEENFNAVIFDAYGATESGPIAFECKDKKLHLHSDLVFTEFLRGGKLSNVEAPSNILVTKLYGEGTPIIRYSGINDIVAPSKEKCDCLCSGKLIKKIYGRDNWYLVLPDGKIMLPLSFSEIFSEVVYECKTRMIQNIQIVQKEINKIEVRLIIDHKLAKTPIKDVFSMIKDGFEKKIGEDQKVSVTVKELKSFKQKGYIISKFKKEDIIEKKYI